MTRTNTDGTFTGLRLKSLQPKSKLSVKVTHRLPMSVSYTRITDGVKYWQMLLEFVNFTLHTICNTSWARLVIECLCKFVHGTPHITYFILNLLCIQILERAYRKGRNVSVNEKLHRASGKANT